MTEMGISALYLSRSSKVVSADEPFGFGESLRLASAGRRILNALIGTSDDGLLFLCEGFRPGQVGPSNCNWPLDPTGNCKKKIRRSQGSVRQRNQLATSRPAIFLGSLKLHRPGKGIKYR